MLPGELRSQSSLSQHQHSQGWAVIPEVPTSCQALHQVLFTCDPYSHWLWAVAKLCPSERSIYDLTVKPGSVTLLENHLSRWSGLKPSCHSVVSLSGANGWQKGKLDPEELRSLLNESSSHGVRGSHSSLSTYKSTFPTTAVQPALQQAGDSHTALHPS